MRSLCGIFLLATVSAAYNFAVYGGVIRGSDLANLAAGYGTGYFAALWVLNDARATRYRPAYHYGLYLWLAGVVLIPHYLLRTRGRAGLGLALGLSAALWAPTATAIAGYFLYPQLPDLR